MVYYQDLLRLTNHKKTKIINAHIYCHRTIYLDDRKQSYLNKLLDAELKGFILKSFHFDLLKYKMMKL